MVHLLIIVSCLLATNSSNTMERNNHNPIAETSTTRLHRNFLINIIGKAFNVPKEINSYITELSLLPRSIGAWKNFGIPPFSLYQELSPEQQKVIDTALASKYSRIPSVKGPQVFLVLKTQEEYETFVTIPYQLRKYLTYMPTSIRKQEKQLANATGSILVENTKQPILPEKNQNTRPSNTRPTTTPSFRNLMLGKF